MAWTEKEIDYLVENYTRKIHIDDLSSSLKKSKRAIRHKASRLGLSRKGMLVKKIGEITPRTIIDKKYYLKNREKIYQRKMQRRWRIKRTIVEMMGGKCSICGYNKCINALEFHHKGKEKDAAIFELIKNSSEQNVLKEVQRCILVCANCHREAHYKGA